MSIGPTPQDPDPRTASSQPPNLSAASAGAQVSLSVREQGLAAFAELAEAQGLRRMSQPELSLRLERIGHIIADAVFDFDRRRAQHGDENPLAIDFYGGAEDAQHPGHQYFLLSLRNAADTCMFLGKGEPTPEHLFPPGLLAAVWVHVGETATSTPNGIERKFSIGGQWIFSDYTDVALEKSYRERRIDPLLRAVVMDHATAPKGQVPLLSRLHFPAKTAPTPILQMVASREDGTHYWIEVRPEKGALARFIPDQGEFSNRATWHLVEELRSAPQTSSITDRFQEYWREQNGFTFAHEDRQVRDRLEALEPTLRRMLVHHYASSALQAPSVKFEIEVAGVREIAVPEADGSTKTAEWIFLVTARDKDSKCLLLSSKSERFEPVPGFAGIMLTGQIGLDRRLSLHLEGTIIDKPGLGSLFQTIVPHPKRSVLAESLLETINSGRTEQGLDPLAEEGVRFHVSQIMKGEFGDVFGVLAHYPGGIYQSCIFVQRQTGLIPNRDGLLVTAHLPRELSLPMPG